MIRSIGLVWWVLAVSVVVVGCGDDGDTSDGSESGDGSGDGADTQTDTAGDSGDGSDDSGDGGSGSGESAGEDAGETGDSGGTGTTGADPCDCAVGGYRPVCGVDGMTYDAICGDECVPVEIDCEGECPCAGLMCGDMECQPDDAVCTTTFAGPADIPPEYECGDLPPDCQGLPDPDCSCFGVGCDCVEDPDDRFQIECYLP